MSDATKRVTFEGRRTTVRSVKMLQEARKNFTKKTGRRHPSISQGGYNAGGVKASAGTHDRDAFDHATASFSSKHSAIWESCLGEVGFAAWWRRFIRGLWPQHTHGIPKGGDISRGAASQVAQYRNGRDGLVSARSYPAISKWRGRTWEGYLKTKPKPLPKGYLRIASSQQKKLDEFLMPNFNKGRRLNKKNWRESFYVQTWLKGLGYYKSVTDGWWGKVSEAALKQFCQKNKIVMLTENGNVTRQAITALNNAARAKKVALSNIPVVMPDTK